MKGIKTQYRVILMATMCAAGMGGAYAGLDTTLDVPQAPIVFYVHGHLNIVFSSNTTTTAYASYVPGGLESAFEYDVETRPVGGGEWSVHAGSLSKYASVAETEFRDTSRFYWLGTSQLDSSVEVRARIRITKAGDAKYGAWSDWGSLGTAEVLAEVGGTIINTTSSRSGLADDGNVNTYFESGSDVGSLPPTWTGIDAGYEVAVTRIRFTHRSFSAVSRPRGRGAVFEAASNADFSDAVQLHVVPNNYDPYVVNDVLLPAPVRARYFRVRTAASQYCNFTEVQWVGESGCGVVVGDGVEVNHEGEADVFDYRAHVAVQGETGRMSSLRLLRGYSSSGPFEAISGTLSPSDSLVAVDDVSGVGMPCHYCWECTMNSGLILTGAVSSAYIRPRQLERDAADQTTFGEGVALLPVNALFPDKTYTVGFAASLAFDGIIEGSTSPNIWFGSTNPVIGVSLSAPSHLSCVFVNADLQNDNRPARMKRLAFYGAMSVSAMNAGAYDQLTGRITTYQRSDDKKWFRYISTDTNTLHSCLFGYAPVGEQWCGHSREIRFVGWTEADEVDSGKVFAPAGVSLACSGMKVTIRWTAAVNATSISIERRQQGGGDWTLVAQNVDPALLSYTDDSTLRGGKVYEYRVRATGLGGMMTAEAEPVLIEVPRSGFILTFR